MTTYTVIALLQYPQADFVKIVETEVGTQAQLRDLLNILEASELVVDFSVYIPLGKERVGMEHFEFSGYKKWSSKD